MLENARLSSDRRTVLRAGGAGMMLFSLAGHDIWMTPGQARERGAELRHLQPREAAVLEALADALVPGARAAGIAHYVDANLARPPADCLLTIRYFDVLPPFDAFYADALKALDAYSLASAGAEFVALPVARAKEIVGQMLGGKLPGWQGPSSALLYLAVRSDAVDLVYGTMEAFERLGLPYVPHIEPKTVW